MLVSVSIAQIRWGWEGFHEVVSMLASYTVNFHLKEVSIQGEYHKMGFDVGGKPFGQVCLPLKVDA